MLENKKTAICIMKFRGDNCEIYRQHRHHFCSYKLRLGLKVCPTQCILSIGYIAPIHSVTIVMGANDHVRSVLTNEKRIIYIFAYLGP